MKVRFLPGTAVGKVTVHHIGDRVEFECVIKRTDVRTAYTGLHGTAVVETVEVRIWGWIGSDGSCEVKSTCISTRATTRAALSVVYRHEEDMLAHSAHHTDRGPGNRPLLEACDA